MGTNPHLRDLQSLPFGSPILVPTDASVGDDPRSAEVTAEVRPRIDAVARSAAQKLDASQQALEATTNLFKTPAVMDAGANDATLRARTQSAVNALATLRMNLEKVRKQFEADVESARQSADTLEQPVRRRRIVRTG
jgi:hypothetical protein